MKRFSRGRSATGQSTTNNGRTEHVEKSKVPRRKECEDAQPPASVPRSRSSVEMHLKAKKLSDFHFVEDGWIDPFPPFPPPYYTQIPVSSADISNSDISNDPPAPESSPQRTTEGYPSQSFLRPDSPPKSIVTRGRRSSYSSTSTLFESSNAVPITIVVTTPDEEPRYEAAGGYFPGQPIRMSRNSSSISLPRTKSPPKLDRNHLMPPINAQVDTRRLRKAREFEDIKHFLVGFLNTKGSQLPNRLRKRVMSIYGITDLDLDPTVVAKFGSEGAALDEGIVLDLGRPGSMPTDRDHLRVLEIAFQSVTPSPTPNAARDILAARRKAMSMSQRDTASLHSVDSYSRISTSMSLSVNNKSKQTLDSIITNRALLQSTKRPPNLASVTATSPTPPANPKPQSSSIFRRRSLQVQSSRSRSSSQSMVVPPQNSTTTPQEPTWKQRPRSLFRYTTSPTSTIVSTPPNPPIPAMPVPAFNYPSSRSRHMKAETPPAITFSSHKPARSSQLTRSPLTASFPERPLSIRQELRTPPLDFDPSKSKSAKEEEDQNVPVKNLDKLETPTPQMSPPLDEARAILEPVNSNKIPSPVPRPMITNQNTERPEILSPVPITPFPTHILAHKGLTRSEVSDMEKPFYVRRRRSSSTLNAVSPRSPPFPPTTPSPPIDDESGFVFPAHPCFAPLETEKSHAGMSAEERRSGPQEQKWNNSTTVRGSDRKAEGKLKKKERREKRGSIFETMKRSLFGRS